MRALRDKLNDLWNARELLRQLVGKELKVRYKRSALGFLWSLLTPILMTAVFTAVFAVLIKIQVEDFAAFFVAGYLVWAFFQNSVQSSVHAITGNGPLIRKVYFPREVLPLSTVLAQSIHFVLALAVLLPFLVYTRGAEVLVYLPAVAVGIVLVGVFAAGLAMLFAAANVSFRDLQELVVVIFLIWFYATPVIYPYEMAVEAAGGVPGRLLLAVLAANPMTWFVRFFRQPLYGVIDTFGVPDPASTAPTWPAPEIVAATALVAAATFVLGYLLFHRFAVTFAKEV